MDNLDQAFLDAVELHSADQLRSCLDAGLDLHMPIRGRLPIQWMTAMYTRSDELANCLKLLLDGGGQLDDPAIEPVLLDDAPSLREAIRSGRLSIDHHTTLESAFTPLEGASLLHVAAEFGNQMRRALSWNWARTSMPGRRQTSMGWAAIHRCFTPSTRTGIARNPS